MPAPPAALSLPLLGFGAAPFLAGAAATPWDGAAAAPAGSLPGCAGAGHGRVRSAAFPAGLPVARVAGPRSSPMGTARCQVCWHLAEPREPWGHCGRGSGSGLVWCSKIWITSGSFPKGKDCDFFAVSSPYINNTAQCAFFPSFFPHFSGCVPF